MVKLTREKSDRKIALGKTEDSKNENEGEKMPERM